MPSILTRLNARRHSRGFGVHSPFAFEFITEVLCQPRHYYAYAQLPRDSRQRLLHRLVVALQPKAATVVCADSALWWPAIKSAVSACRLDEETPEFVLANATEASPEELLAYIDKGAHLMIVNAESCLRDAIKTHMQARGHGMTFANSCGTIIVANYSHLPAQHFNVRF